LIRTLLLPTIYPAIFKGTAAFIFSIHVEDAIVMMEAAYSPEISVQNRKMSEQR